MLVSIATVCGLVLEIAGFGYTAVVMRSEWIANARSGEYFEPRWLRRMLRRPNAIPTRTVHAEMTATGHSFASVRPVFDGTGSPEERIEQLERWMSQVLVNASTAEQRLDAKDRDLEQQIQAAADATSSRFARIDEELRQESVLDLRRTGWGLTAAAAGMLLQVPAAITSLF